MKPYLKLNKNNTSFTTKKIIMTTFPILSNRTNTQILRIDILEEGASFNTSDKDHNAALILEDSNGHKYGIEYISIEEFATFFCEYTMFVPSEIFELLGRYAEDFEEDSIDFSITDAEMIEFFEAFRVSEDNSSGDIHPYND